MKGVEGGALNEKGPGHKVLSFKPYLRIGWSVAQVTPIML